jgi:hypothetical protein
MPTPTTSEFDARKSINVGYLKKNRYKPPHTGKGRSKGQKNVVTQSVREMFYEFVQNNAAKVQELFDRVAKRDPFEALQVYSNMVDFVLPRLARTETTVTGDPLVSATPISDPSAASIYAAILGHTKFDLNVITFAPPQPGNVVAVQAQEGPDPGP